MCDGINHSHLLFEEDYLHTLPHHSKMAATVPMTDEAMASMATSKSAFCRVDRRSKTPLLTCAAEEPKKHKWGDMFKKALPWVVGALVVWWGVAQWQKKKRQEASVASASAQPSGSAGAASADVVVTPTTFLPGQYYNVDTQGLSNALASGMPFVAMFYARWCGPCRLAKPNFIQAAKQSPIPFVAVEQRFIPSTMDSGSYPTIQRFRNGQVEATFNGTRSVQGFTDFASQ